MATNNMENTYREVALREAGGQKPVIDMGTRKTPILFNMPTEVATDNHSNTFEELVSVDIGGLRVLDQEAQEVGTVEEQGSTPINIISGKMTVTRDKLRELKQSPQDYFAGKAGKIIPRTLMAAEASIYKNSLLQNAIDSNNLLNAGGTGSNNSTIVAVNWDGGDNIGLTSPLMAQSGLVFESVDLLGGGTMENPTRGLVTTPKGQSVSGYAVQLDARIGIQLLNSQKLSAIVNVDPRDGKIPPIEQFAEMILNCEGGDNTAIYMSYRTLSALGLAYKLPYMNLYTEEEGINLKVYMIDGIPLIPSRQVSDAGSVITPLS